MKIRMKKNHRFKNGGRWTQGATITTSADELNERGVPDDAYETLGEVRTSEVGPAETTTKPVRKKKPRK